MIFWRSANGLVTLSLVTADPGEALDSIRRAGITVYDVCTGEDVLKLRLQIRRQDMKKMEALTQRKGYDLRIEHRSGSYWLLTRAKRRPVLVFGCMILLALTLWLPTRVLFICVKGNEQISTGLILEKCDQCGIRFGASRRLVRSEKTKNALLDAIPELSWAGVNMSGCVATITVQERSREPQQEQGTGVCGITAARDGIITDMTVVRGNALCTVGQAVRAGELLVSGYVDCGIKIQAMRAQAEIYAQTRRSLTAAVPIQQTIDGQNTAQEQNISVLIGKKRINLLKGSGISGTSCDKIYSEYYLTLPGGFRLPVAIVVEACYLYETASASQAQEDAQLLLEDFAQRYLTEQMVAGEILLRYQKITMQEDLVILQGYYACEEMIAQVRNEEIIKPNGNDH